MNISYLFGFIAGISLIITYSLYFKQTLKGESNPNPSTWTIWLLIGIINAATYFSLTNNNLWQSFIMIVAPCSVFFILVYSLFKGKFSKISKIEIIMFGLAIAIGIFWQITSNDRISNLILQVIYIISFVPTISGIIRKRSKEHPTAWIAASISYLFSIISIALANQIDWIAFIHPVVIGLLGNGIVAALIIHQRQ